MTSVKEFLDKVDNFDKFLQDAPEEIKKYIANCWLTPQNSEWHPEGKDEMVPHNVLMHTRIVFRKCLYKYNNFSHLIDLLLSAIFHDLGKVDTTKLNKHDKWSSYGHEAESAKIVKRHKEWIEHKGGNFDRVYNIVNEHMRIKHIDEMRPAKKQKLFDNPFFAEIVMFNKCDNMKDFEEFE